MHTITSCLHAFQECFPAIHLMDLMDIWRNRYAPIVINTAVYTGHVLARVSLALYLCFKCIFFDLCVKLQILCVWLGVLPKPGWPTPNNVPECILRRCSALHGVYVSCVHTVLDFVKLYWLCYSKEKRFVTVSTCSTSAVQCIVGQYCCLLIITSCTCTLVALVSGGKWSTEARIVEGFSLIYQRPGLYLICSSLWTKPLAKCNVIPIAHSETTQI